MTDTLYLIMVVGSCSALSFLFSGMESGVFALSRLRIRQQTRTGNRRARVLHGYLENSEDFLWTILVGNTLLNFIAVSLMVHALYGWTRRIGHPSVFWLVLMLVIFLFYALCDLLPKMLFRLYPNRLCLAVVPFFRLTHYLLAPFVFMVAWFANGLLRWTGGKIFTGHLFDSRDELRHVMQDSAQALTTEERAMINRVMDLQHLKVRQITVPLNKTATAASNTTVGQLLEMYRQYRFTRLPIWQHEGKTRRIVGIVNLQTLLYANELLPSRTARDYLKPAVYLDEALRLQDALQLMQRSGHRLGIVLGLDRREVGIVSLEDILKSIFGEVSL
jgi:magnesium and cobalt exporter, CNNM family